MSTYRVYKVRGGDDYSTCWVVAENAPQARRIASERSHKLRGYAPSELTARHDPIMEPGTDVTTARYLYDIDTGLEPEYGYQYSW